MKFACTVLIVALQLGCTATCLRDSDCIGDSICFQDRCLLVHREDGGAGTLPAQGGAGGSRSATAGSAGSTQGQGGVGGTTTDPRLNLDAATDSAPSDSID